MSVDSDKDWCNTDTKTEYLVTRTGLRYKHGSLPLGPRKPHKQRHHLGNVDPINPSIDRTQTTATTNVPSNQTRQIGVVISGPQDTLSQLMQRLKNAYKSDRRKRLTTQAPRILRCLLTGDLFWPCVIHITQTILMSQCPSLWENLRWLRSNHLWVLGIVPFGFRISVRRACKRGYLKLHPDKIKKTGRTWGRTLSSVDPNDAFIRHNEACKALQHVSKAGAWLLAVMFDWAAVCFWIWWICYTLVTSEEFMEAWEPGSFRAWRTEQEQSGDKSLGLKSPEHLPSEQQEGGDDVHGTTGADQELSSMVYSYPPRQWRTQERVEIGHQLARPKWTITYERRPAARRTVSVLICSHHS